MTEPDLGHHLHDHIEPVDNQDILSLYGIVPYGEELDRFARGIVDDIADRGGMSDAMHSKVLTRMDLLNRDPKTRLLSRLAREAHIPYTEAAERWDDDDLAHEIAAEAYESAAKARICPSCGTDPNDYQDPVTKRLLPHGRLKLQRWDCFMCQQIALNRRMLSDDDRERGTDIRVMARNLGDPFVESGDLAEES